MAITPKNNVPREPKLFHFSYISMTNPPIPFWGLKMAKKGVFISLANLLQIALPVTGQWVTDYESINPISGRGVVFHSDLGCLKGGGLRTPPAT